MKAHVRFAMRAAGSETTPLRDEPRLAARGRMLKLTPSCSLASKDAAADDENEDDRHDQ